MARVFFVGWANFMSMWIAKEGEYFVPTRNRIRKTLAEEGIAGDIDKLVEKLLGPV